LNPGRRGGNKPATNRLSYGAAYPLSLTKEYTESNDWMVNNELERMQTEAVIFAGSNAGIVGSNPTRGIDVCIMRVYFVFGFFCV
jgi:hypothetical protein